MKSCNKCGDYPGIKQEGSTFSWKHKCGNAEHKSSNHKTVKKASSDWNKTVKASSGGSTGCLIPVMLFIVVVLILI